MASQQTSGELASAIIIDARELLVEDTESFFRDDKMLRWLNRGSANIATRAHCLEGLEIESLVVHQLSYSITDAYIYVRGVVYAQSNGVEKSLVRGNLKQIGWVNETGEPAFWCTERDNVIVYPRPDAGHSGAGHDIKVFTVKWPEPVTAGDAVLTPACYDHALVLYIVAQGLYRDGQYGKANSKMNEYYAEVDRYMVDIVNTPKQTEDMVQVQ